MTTVRMDQYFGSHNLVQSACKSHKPFRRSHATKSTSSPRIKQTPSHKSPQYCRRVKRSYCLGKHEGREGSIIQQDGIAVRAVALPCSLIALCIVPSSIAALTIRTSFLLARYKCTCRLLHGRKEGARRPPRHGGVGISAQQSGSPLARLLLVLNRIRLQEAASSYCREATSEDGSGVGSCLTMCLTQPKTAIGWIL